MEGHIDRLSNVGWVMKYVCDCVQLDNNAAIPRRCNLVVRSCSFYLRSTSFATFFSLLPYEVWLRWVCFRFVCHFSCHLRILTNLISFSMERMLLIILSFDLFCSFALAKCYYPDGSEMGANYRPCDSGKEFNMCCAEGDECRPDGLCFNNQTNLIYRDGCTDPSWESSSCIKLCNTGLGTSIPPFVNPSIRAEKARGRKDADAWCYDAQGKSKTARA